MGGDYRAGGDVKRTPKPYAQVTRCINGTTLIRIPPGAEYPLPPAVERLLKLMPRVDVMSKAMCCSKAHAVSWFDAKLFKELQAAIKALPTGKGMRP